MSAIRRRPSRFARQQEEGQSQNQRVKIENTAKFRDNGSGSYSAELSDTEVKTIEESGSYLTAPVDCFIPSHSGLDTTSKTSRSATGSSGSSNNNNVDETVSNTKGTKRVLQLEQKIRAEGLQKPLGPDNCKGFGLLLKLGGEQRPVLEAAASRSQAALAAADCCAASREGIGVSAKRARVQQLREESIQQHAGMQFDFSREQSRHFSDGETQRQLQRATTVLYELQLRTVQQQRYGKAEDIEAMLHPLVVEKHREITLRTLGSASLHDEEEEHLHHQQNQKQYQQQQPQHQYQQLLEVLQCLRVEHFFCFYCGYGFTDKEDLQAQCPGIEESLHD